MLAEIEAGKAQIRMEAESLRQFEKDLQLLEKRLNNLKISLKK